MRIGGFEIEPLLVLLVFVPIAIALEFMHADPVWIFVASSAAIAAPVINVLPAIAPNLTSGSPSYAPWEANAMNALSDLGSVATTSRMSRSASAPRSTSQKNRPNSTIGAPTRSSMATNTTSTTPSLGTLRTSPLRRPKTIPPAAAR